MDTKKECIIPECGNLPDFGNFKVVVGSKQLKKALLNGRARYVCLAENADPAITSPLEELCVQQGVRFTWIESMAELGRACGIEVGAAAAAAVD